jgi:hypothetical protein
MTLNRMYHCVPNIRSSGTDAQAHPRANRPPDHWKTIGAGKLAAI